jgi:hypothetical protein
VLLGRFGAPDTSERKSGGVAVTELSTPPPRLAAYVRFRLGIPHRASARALSVRLLVDLGACSVEPGPLGL